MTLPYRYLRMATLSKPSMRALFRRCLLCTFLISFCVILDVRQAVAADCPEYSQHARRLHSPYSVGRYKLAYQRPARECRTFVSREVERTLGHLRSIVKDPDLFRLFLNAFPNTLDTTVRWRGHAANNTEEELAFVVTGDINAMWLRDSTNQLLSYETLLKPSVSGNSLASLYRGVINLQARYLLTSPYCQAFQPPFESGIDPSFGHGDDVCPAYGDDKVFECKFELDSLAAFLSLSSAYFRGTRDAAFFARFQWVSAVRAVLNGANAMAIPTYASNGTVNPSPYTFQRGGGPSTDTLMNGGVGNPVAGGTGLVRSAFRPSDDACIYQFFIPANAMFSHSLVGASAIMRSISGQSDLAGKMSTLAASIRAGIDEVGRVTHPHYGSIYAYEVDGFGSRNLMDDANMPSLLSLPLLGYTSIDDPIYQATRRFVLSTSNPYMSRGSVLNGIGGPHDGPGRPWPMAAIVRIMTSENDTEIFDSLHQIVSSSNGLGLIHESVAASDARSYTRSWFAWANGLFGQMILDLARRKPEMLGRSFQ